MIDAEDIWHLQIACLRKIFNAEQKTFYFLLTSQVSSDGTYQMYRLNVLSLNLIFTKAFYHLNTYHIISSLPFIRFQSLWKLSKHLINRPENCVIGFDILDICFFLTESTDSSWSDHPPALLVSPDCVLWLCDWLWTRRLGYCHHDHDQSPGFPLACAAWPSDPHHAATNMELSINRCNTAETQGPTLGQFNALIIGS